jgi:hypothetical protein
MEGLKRGDIVRVIDAGDRGTPVHLREGLIGIVLGSARGIDVRIAWVDSWKEPCLGFYVDRFEKIGEVELPLDDEVARFE